jgi:hypothetical protein
LSQFTRILSEVERGGDATVVMQPGSNALLSTKSLTILDAGNLDLNDTT